MILDRGRPAAKLGDVRARDVGVGIVYGSGALPADFFTRPLPDLGPGSSALAYVLEERRNKGWAVAAEQYSDFGELRAILPSALQSQRAWAVVDHCAKVDVEADIGFGLNSASDKVTLKLILSRDLN